MELFDVIPASLFTLLTSKNREIYAKALLITRESFINEITIEKEKLISKISQSLQNGLLDFAAFDDEGIKEEDLKDINSTSRSITKRLIETGWIETEFARGTKLSETCSLPPYSIQLLDLLYNLTSEEVKEYDAFMYSIYSSLVSADSEYKDYRYTALCNSYDKVNEFESTLKGLYINLNRHFSRIARLKTVNQILSEHFDSYQKDIIKQIYLPLKTRDSLTRFRGPILQILSNWLRDPEIFDQLVDQAMVQKHFESRDEGQSEIIGKINYISDKLISLQKLLDDIDERNKEYVQTATDKMRHLLRNDKSVKSKLNKITQKLALERLNNENTSIDIMCETFALNAQEIVGEDSLFIRRDAERDYDNGEEIVIVDFNDDVANQALQKLEDGMNSPYSNEGIQQFMHRQMDELDRINSSSIPVENVNMMIMLMYSFIKGFDSKSFYRTQLNDGYTDNQKYMIPDVDFVRKG